MDYALIISLALYFAYGFTFIRPRREGRTAHVIIALLVAIAFYTALKLAFVAAGIQPR